MIKVSVLYPNGKDITFNEDYYCNNQMIMVKKKVGNACKKMAIESGISGIDSGSEAPFIASSHLYFESVDSFQSAFGPHAAEILEDIPNYTNSQPVIQISKVLT